MRIRAAQFNLENFFVYMDAPLKKPTQEVSEQEWQELSHSSTQENKPLSKLFEIAEIIKDIDADIYLLNEVGGVESLNNFNAYFLNNFYEVHLIEGNSDRGIDVGYLCKKDLNFKFNLTSYKDHPLHFLYPHEAELKNLSYSTHYFSRDIAQLDILSQDTSRHYMSFFLTHLKSKLDKENIDPLGRLRRAAEVKALVEIYLKFQQQNPSCPVIVSGDFNGLAHRENQEKEFAEIYDKTDLEEVFDLLKINYPERTTQIQFQSFNSTKLLQFDYFFVNTPLKQALLKEECFVYRFKHSGVERPLPLTLSQRQELPSDHYPVVISFEIK